jgi:prepilin-type N-terminal cleavage/methylation domain-containing protein
VRKAFTLIEFAIVIAIIGTFLALSIPVIFGTGSRYYKTVTTPTIKIMRKYEITVNKSTRLRVDYKQSTREDIEVAILENDTNLRYYGADTLYANLIVGEWYKVKMVGYRDEPYQFFPKIIEATHTTAQDR